MTKYEFFRPSCFVIASAPSFGEQGMGIRIDIRAVPFFSVLTWLFVSLPVSSSASATQGTVDYVRDVKPILAQHCFSCHAAKITKAKLRLDTAASMVKGGASGPAIVPGNAQGSPLIDALKGANGFTAMPLKKPALSPKQIAIIAAWIDQGAKAPADEVADDGTGRNHWAFKPPQRPSLPVVQNAQWPRNAVDRFVLARLEQEKTKPSPEADKVTLLRRVYLDLVGLPPSPGEVDAFLADGRPGAYERVVDRLLASPHYGERWGRHWLDLARYADTHGFSIDGPREVWKYRDWVISALNRDMPFDQFVVEQMAGDMLPNATLQQKIATGFHRNTLINQEGGVDPEQFRVEAVADRVNTTAAVFLGLTLACARCHDHKFDPFTQREYFRLFAFLDNQSEPTLTISGPEATAWKETVRAKIVKLEAELQAAIGLYVDLLPPGETAKIQAGIADILRLPAKQRSEDQKKTLATYFSKKDNGLKNRLDEIAAVKRTESRLPTALVLAELAKPRTTHIHLGGDFTRKGDEVTPGVPAALHALPRPVANASGSSSVATNSGSSSERPNRLDFARWLVDRKNPLLGRVTVNRLWQHYFGKGLVETENDFGTQGLPPTHPELLDWLATEFAGSGSGIKSQESGVKNWSLKAMHRLIVTSATYRQSSKARPDLAEIDPDNRLLARQTRLRLDAEIVRDNALAASGLLSRTIGGPSVFPPQPDGIYRFTQVASSWKISSGEDRFRRGIYTYLKRSAPYPALTVFDAPDGTSTCTRRLRSNTPMQALTLLNDQAFLEMARGLARWVLGAGPMADSERLRLAFRLCLARQPSPSEAKRLERYLALQLDEFKANEAEARVFVLGEAAGSESLRILAIPKDANIPRQAAWTALARVLLNLDEFITRE
jgi:mono/diheme cytochrome c family protein